MKKYTFNRGMLHLWLPQKILLIMRLVIVLLTTCLMQVSAASFAQKLTYSKKGTSLEEIFAAIEQQTGYNVFYSASQINSAKKIDVNFQNTDLTEVLETLARERNLAYTIDDKNISIKLKEPTFLEGLANRWAAIDVRGRVVDQEGKPLSGATVKIKSSGKSVSTNAKGEFYLEKVDEEAVLVISFIGYVSKEVDAGKEMGNIVLEVNNSKLDEVQVIAYGTTTRRLSTGNISSITSTDIEKQPVTNPLLALSGRVPGVFIEQGTGLPGTSVKVRIQGTNSLRPGGNEPLYVIDGVPYLSALIHSFDPGMSVGSAGSPLNFINPSDIERIDVLKDADATSIYGSRAANGAILITTKKGKKGTTSVDFNLQSGIGQMTRKIELLNTEQYLEMRKEAARNDNLDYANTPPFNNPSGVYKDLLTWDQHRYTDWQKELLGGTAHYNNYTISITGGSDNMSYLLGTTYNRQTSVFEGDAANTFGNVHFNLNSSSTNQKFRVQFIGSYQYNLNNLLGMDLTEKALTLPPNAPPLFNKDGSINWARASDGVSTWDLQEHPLERQFNKYQNKTNNLIANSILSYQLLPSLEIKSSFGYTNLQTNEFKIFPTGTLRPELQSTRKGGSYFGNSNNSSWLIEPQVTYKWSLQKHAIDALIGLSFQHNRALGQRLSASDYSTDQVLEDIGAAPRVEVSGTTNTVYRYMALYGRLNYAYDNKYIINLSIRNDGSSRFGTENRFHSFASAGAAWLFSNETAVKDLVPFLSFGKLRTSYGTTGNDQIGDYGYMSLYRPFFGVSRPYQGIGSMLPAGLSNPYFQWEETRKLSVGLDLGFVKDRILLNVNYNRNRSSNQLLYYDLPIITGFWGLTVNFPAVIQNTGWEFSLNTVNIHSGNFNWTSGINLTIPKNKLVAYPGLATSSYANNYIVGKSINIDKEYHWIGVNPETGLHQFETKDGGTTSNPSDMFDRIVVSNIDPKFYGGIQNRFSYKGWSLDVFTAFTSQMGDNYRNGQSPGASARNQPADVLDRWQQKGDVTKVQRYGRNASTFPSFVAYMFSDGRFADASYLRVKNISLSWQLPENWQRKVHFRNCRLFLQGQNLFTITNYAGLDPENKSIATLPPLRVITTGIQITL